MSKQADTLDLVLKATEFAAHKHRNQRRKDANASPYINHPIALARVLRVDGGVDDAAVIAAALLHDIIANPPAAWSVARKREYFDWAKRVVDQVRGTNLRLERRFDSLYRKRP